MSYEIDYKHWAMMKKWGVRQAACLLLNIAPEQDEADNLHLSRHKWKLLTEAQKLEINQRQELVNKKAEQINGWFNYNGALRFRYKSYGWFLYDETHPFQYVEEELNNPSSQQQWKNTNVNLFTAIAEQFSFSYEASETYSGKKNY